MFERAERSKAKLRLGICGPSGSGKTYSSLLIAKGIGNKIAIADTENRSANLYAHLYEYDTCHIPKPYTVEKYIKAIDEAEKAGYDVLILDSISHAWAGEGGLLDQQGAIADSGRGNSYTAWRKVTPMHNKFIERMLNCDLHLIATMRSKTEYVLVEQNGKQVPRKVGMAPVQREGMDYEFTVVFDLDLNHKAQTSKDRTSIFDSTIFTPTNETGKQLKTWLEVGKESPKAQDAPPPPEDDVGDFDEPKNEKPPTKLSQPQEALCKWIRNKLTAMDIEMPHNDYVADMLEKPAGTVTIEGLTDKERNTVKSMLVAA